MLYRFRVPLLLAPLLGVLCLSGAQEHSTAAAADRSPVAIKSAVTEPDRFPCVDGPCSRETVITVKSQKKCLRGGRALAVNVVEQTAYIQLTARAQRKGRACKRASATLTVAGNITSVIDSTTGLPVPTRVHPVY